MPWRTLALALALTAVVTAAPAALVAEPSRHAVAGEPVLALTEAVRPMRETERRATLREATLTAPIPASVALFGAALCGLGLVYRSRG